MQRVSAPAATTAANNVYLQAYHDQKQSEHDAVDPMLQVHRGEAVKYALEALDHDALALLLNDRRDLLDLPLDDFNEPGGERDICRQKIQGRIQQGQKGWKSKPQGSNGETQLHYLAGRKGSHRAVKVLLQMGASPNIRETWMSQTPLHVAAKTGDVDVARVLCKHGATIHTHDKLGASALHLASRFGNTSFVQWCVKHGLDPRHTDSKGRTPLHLAAAMGNADTAVALLDLKADVTATLPGSDRSAMHEAVRYRHANVIEALVRRAGIGLLHEQDDAGRTPLHEAVLPSTVADNYDIERDDIDDHNSNHGVRLGLRVAGHLRTSPNHHPLAGGRHHIEHSNRDDNTVTRTGADTETATRMTHGGYSCSVPRAQGPTPAHGRYGHGHGAASAGGGASGASGASGGDGVDNFKNGRTLKTTKKNDQTKTTRTTPKTMAKPNATAPTSVPGPLRKSSSLQRERGNSLNTIMSKDVNLNTITANVSSATGSGTLDRLGGVPVTQMSTVDSSFNFEPTPGLTGLGPTFRHWPGTKHLSQAVVNRQDTPGQGSLSMIDIILRLDRTNTFTNLNVPSSHKPPGPGQAASGNLKSLALVGLGRTSSGDPKAITTGSANLKPTTPVTGSLLEVRTFSDGHTALHLAISKGDVEATDALLRQGADPYAVDARDVSAMQMMLGKAALLTEAGDLDGADCFQTMTTLYPRIV